MSKLASWSACSAAVLALGAGILAANAAQAAPRNQPPFVIGVSNDSVANPFRVQMINELKYYAEKHPDVIKELIVLNAGEDTNKQISDVQDLLSRGVDGILLSPNSATAFNAVLRDAKQLGVPVATYNMSLAEGAQVIAQIAPPFTQWQHDTTAWLAKAMGGKGNVIALRGIVGTPVDAEEWAGAKQVLDQNPGIKVICSEYANWDYGAAKTAVQNCLANHPEVNGILSLGDASTWAAGEVMASQGYDLSKIPMIGIGAGNGALKWWVNTPGINAYIIADHTDVSVIALENLINTLEGKKGEVIGVPELAVTNDNVKKYAQMDMPDNVWLVGTQLPVDVLKTQATR